MLLGACAVSVPVTAEPAPFEDPAEAEEPMDAGNANREQLLMAFRLTEGNTENVRSRPPSPFAQRSTCSVYDTYGKQLQYRACKKTLVV